jgi:hypothetical protein
MRSLENYIIIEELALRTVVFPHANSTVYAILLNLLNATQEY